MPVKFLVSRKYNFLLMAPIVFHHVSVFFAIVVVFSTLLLSLVRTLKRALMVSSCVIQYTRVFVKRVDFL